MDEYTKEMRELGAQIDALVEADEDATTIAELQMQLDLLEAIYTRARELWDRGQADPGLRRTLSARGYGPWSFENAYAFVYETSVELPGSGHRAFLAQIREADFTGLLLGSGVEQPLT